MKKSNLKIKWEFHRGIFTLYCAYCTWGKELQFGKFNEKSKAYYIVKKFIIKNHIVLDPELSKLLEKDHPSYFVARALRYNEKLSLCELKSSYEKPNSWYKNFDKLLDNFYRKNNFSQIEKECGTWYQKQIHQYLTATKKIIGKTNDLLMLNPIGLGIKELILAPNQIDRTRQGYGMKIDKVAYIVFSDSISSKIKMGLIQHEYLHSIINPEFEKSEIKRIIKKTEYLYESFVIKEIGKFYTEWKFVLIEYVIRAIEGWTYRDQKKEKYIQTEENRGFIKICQFMQMEKIYLSQPKNFIEFLPVLLNEILIKNKPCMAPSRNSCR